MLTVNVSLYILQINKVKVPHYHWKSYVQSNELWSVQRLHSTRGTWIWFIITLLPYLPGGLKRCFALEMTLCIFGKFPESFQCISSSSTIPIKGHVETFKRYQRAQNGNERTPKNYIHFLDPFVRKCKQNATRMLKNLILSLQGVMGNIDKFRTCCACFVFPAKKIGICFCETFLGILRFIPFFWV